MVWGGVHVVGEGVGVTVADSEGYEAFVTTVGATVRRALVAAYGTEVGAEAAADALAWAWEHWAEVQAMANPAGYLYRVGQSRSRRYRPRVLRRPGTGPADAPPPPDVDLARALGHLTAPQRSAVVLVHGHGHTLADAAAVLGCSVSTLRNHLRRGLSKLRDRLEPTDD